MDTGKFLTSLLTVLSENGIVIPMDNLQNPNQYSQNLKAIGKKHGFKLNKVNDHFEVRYKDGEQWLSTKKIIYTSIESEAIDFAIKEKEKIIREYKERKDNRLKRKDNVQLYKMLNGYFTENSIYLQRDNNDNKMILSPKLIHRHSNIVKKFLIPFLKEKKINSFEGITKSVYSDFKIYLQNKNYTAGHINNILSVFNRILNHAERYEIIPKLPYSKGMGVIRKSEEEKARNIGDPLPIEKLKHIITLCHKLFMSNILESWEVLLLMALGLTTGMRDKEIGNIRVNDIKFVVKEDMHILYVSNKKNEKYLTERSEKYRKIPLHPFVVELLKDFIKRKKKASNDFLFGKNNSKAEYRLNYKYTVHAIFYVLIAIRVKEKLQENATKDNIFPFMETIKNFENVLESLEELKDYANKNNYHFYSFRHTLITIMQLERMHPDWNDYFTGHKPSAKIRDNYTHINSVENNLFCQQYGKPYLDMINKYFFPEKTQEEIEAERKETVQKFTANQEGEIKENINSIFECI
jgi:integrase